jgi:competence protein ComFC
LVYYIKRHREKSVFCFLSEELLEGVGKMMTVEEMDPQNTVITYVPRSKGAYLQHGVDQAKELAKELALRIGIPAVSAICRRGGKGTAQKKLDLPNRLKNAGSAYGVKNKVDLGGKDVLLVDDIVTSGATMAVCVRLLRQMGAKRVYCVAVAADDMQRDGDGMADPEKRKSRNVETNVQ